MKPSNNAIFDYFLALLIFIIAITLASYWNRMEVGAFGIGIADLLFIFGIQSDLYDRDNEKKKVER